MALPLRLPGRHTTQPTTAPRVTIAPAPRRFAWFAGGLLAVVAALLAATVLLHTSIAERQLKIDELGRGVRSAQAEFDLLRAERAELRAPARLDAEASALGMVDARRTEFVEVDPMTLAIVIAQTGVIPADISAGEDSTSVEADPLDQFRQVKSLSGEAP